MEPSLEPLMEHQFLLIFQYFYYLYYYYVLLFYLFYSSSCRIVVKMDEKVYSAPIPLYSKTVELVDRMEHGGNQELERRSSGSQMVSAGHSVKGVIEEV